MSPADLERVVQKALREFCHAPETALEHEALTPDHRDMLIANAVALAVLQGERDRHWNELQNACRTGSHPDPDLARFHDYELQRLDYELDRLEAER